MTASNRRCQLSWRGAIARHGIRTLRHAHVGETAIHRDRLLSVEWVLLSRWAHASDKPSDEEAVSSVGWVRTQCTSDLAVAQQFLPSTKEECRDDFATFEIFKNQGDCVSFVMTDGGGANYG